MILTRMKKWILIFIAARLMVSGVEEYIILPTAWIYIRSFGQSETFLALVLSAYSIGYVVFCPVFGLLSDKFRHPRTIMVICHLSRVCGSAIYSIPVSIYCPLIGRFLSGVSAGGDCVLFGEVARATDEEERAKVFVLLDGMYTLGASFGPALASALDFEVNILGLKINEGNSPGFVMALVWVVIALITFYLPSKFESSDDVLEKEALTKCQTGIYIALEEENFPEKPFTSSTEKNFGQSGQVSIFESQNDCVNVLANEETDNFAVKDGFLQKTASSRLTNEVFESSQFRKNREQVELKEPLALNCGIDDTSGKFFEKIPLKGVTEGFCESSQNKDRDELKESLSNDGVDTSSEEKNLLEEIPSKNKSGILCLFYFIFTSWFFACVATFYAPLFAMELLHLPSMHVKLLFLNGSLLLILLYLLLYIASEYYQERGLLKFSISLQIIPIIALAVFALFWNDALFFLSYLLIIYVCLGMPCFPYTLACSLLSKLCAEDEINFYQGLSFSISQIAFISGRVFPSFMLTKITLAILSFGLGVLWMVGLLWLYVVYDRLVPDSTR